MNNFNNNNVFDDGTFDFGDLSDFNNMNDIHLGSHFDFTSFGAPGQDPTLDQALDRSVLGTSDANDSDMNMFDINGANGNEYSDMNMLFDFNGATNGNEHSDISMFDTSLANGNEHSDINMFDIGGANGNKHSDPNTFDISGANSDVNSNTSTFTYSTPVTIYSSEPSSPSNTITYQPDPDLNTNFEDKMRDELRREIIAMEKLINEGTLAKSSYTNVSNTPMPAATIPKRVYITTKKPRAKKASPKASPEPPFRVTKPRARKPKAPKAKIAQPTPNNRPFTLYQEHRLQAAVLQFLGSPSLQQQFQAQYGTDPARLQQFMNDPEAQQKLVQKMVNMHLTNPAFQRMLSRTSYGY